MGAGGAGAARGRGGAGGAPAEAEAGGEAEAQGVAPAEAEAEAAAPGGLTEPEVSPLAGIAGQPYLASLDGKANIPPSIIKRINKQDPSSTSIGQTPTFLVAKATECLLATIIAKGVKVAAARAAAAEDGSPLKRARLTYDDLRGAALSLKEGGVISDVSFLNRVLPQRTQEDPAPPAPAPTGSKPANPAKAAVPSESLTTVGSGAAAAADAESAGAAPAGGATGAEDGSAAAEGGAATSQ